MNEARQDNKLMNSMSDSFLGMAIAQAFMGAVYGVGVDIAWEAAEDVSAIYEDRVKAGELNAGQYKIGAQHSLGGAFSQSAKHKGVDAIIAPALPMRSLSLTPEGYGFH